MPETYGYVRTSRHRVSELSGSDPETLLAMSLSRENVRLNAQGKCPLVWC